MNQINGEVGYLNLLREVLDNGALRNSRAGDTLSVFGRILKFNLNDEFPLLTTKRTFWRGIAEELLWFITGSTNANQLREKNIHIWDGNTTREFLDNLGLQHLPEGDLGELYGFQWRHFGAEYTNMNADYTGKGFDQLRDVINKIKNTPNDRRIMITALNPASVKNAVLAPCHVMCQFNVANGKLNSTLYQRSCDMFLGVPFNIASYALLTNLIAHSCGLKPGEFTHFLADTHIYTNHIEQVRTQLERTPYKFPTLEFMCDAKDIDDYTMDDFKIVNYKCHPSIKAEMNI